jgi:two-component system, response regulator
MGTKTILLIEDNPDDVELAKRAFRKSGFDCTLVVKNDGEEALDYLSEIANDEISYDKVFPDLILLDINMPKLNGIEFLKLFRANKQTQCIPVIILTSSKEERDLFACYSAGANSYIQKPVDYYNFIDTIRHLVMYWLVINETVTIQHSRIGGGVGELGSDHG